MKRTTLLDALRNRLPALPQLVPATGGLHVQFASAGGGGGGDEDFPDDDFYEEEAPDDESVPRRERRPARRPTAARQRTVQTDPDDRYWTDYLRIALPVIGLLLVIAVFWFWAQQLIDNDAGDLTPTAQPGLAEIVDTPAEPTETPATPPADTSVQQPEPTATPSNPLQAFPSPTPPSEEPPVGTDNQADEQATEEPQADTGGIAPETTVVVTENVNLRSAPTASEDNVVTVLTAGTQLTVLSGPEESENYLWWEVLNPETADQGWVVQDYIEPAG